jgi:zinc protease
MKPLIGVLLTVALVLCAQPAVKETPPPGGPPKPFAVPKRETYTLKNGMKVSLVPYGTIPLVSVRAVVDAGSINETAGQVWLANFLASMMREGTAAKTNGQLAEAAASMGGELSVNARADVTNVSLGVLSEFTPEAVKLIAEVLRTPRLPASELERIRTNLLRQRSVSLSRPQSLATEAFAKQIYGDHPYGRSFPTEEQLKSYTLDDLKTFYTSNFGAKRTHLYIAGRFDPSIKKTIAEAFDGWAEGSPFERTAPKLSAKKSMTLIDRPGAAQSVLRIGLPVATDPSNSDYIPMEVMDSILGGSFGSRITSNIREAKGYTYSPSSFVDTRYHTAAWNEIADVTTAVTGDSIKEILFEIARLRKEPPTEVELKSIQSYLSGVFVLQNSSRDGLIGQFSFVDLQRLNDDYLRTYVPKVNAVTRADVQRMAEQYLDPNKMTFVVVGDKAKVEESLKAYQ